MATDRQTPNSPARGESLRAAEVIGALSLAIDLGTGQPLEHALRTAALAVRLGELAGATGEDLSDTYYVALLHPSGCTSNGHEAIQVYDEDIAMTEIEAYDTSGRWRERVFRNDARRRMLAEDRLRADTSADGSAAVDHLGRVAVLPLALLGGWIDGVTGAGLAVAIVFVTVMTLAVIRGALEGIREGHRRRQLAERVQAKGPS